MKIAWILLLQFALVADYTHSQTFPEINFSLLSTANGLPTNLITTIFKDSRGLIWIGTTNNGLLRYDGKKIKSYHGTNTKGTSINANFVGNVCEDQRGAIWIATFQGLYHLNPFTEEAALYHHDEKDTNSIASNDNPKILADSKGNIWIAGRNGLQEFDWAKKNFINYRFPPILDPELQFSAKDVKNGMMEDSQRRLWVCCGFGLYLVDKASRSLKPFFHSNKYIEATGIIEDSQHQLLVSFWGGGIKIFDPKAGKYTDVYNSADNTIRWLIKWEDADRKKWFCFEENAVFTLLDPITKRCKQYHPDKAVKNSIKSKEINYIYSDDEERLWICTNAGISIVDKQKQHFISHLLHTDIVKNDRNLMDWPIAFLNKDGEYYVSDLYSGYVFIYDKNWNLVKKIDDFPTVASLKFNFVVSAIQEDVKGNIWYGTTNGFTKQAGNSFKTYIPADTFPSVIGRYSARSILQRPDGLYWARFSNRGVYVFDAEKGVFTKNYGSQYKGLASFIGYDKTGKLWLGSTEGLYQYEPGKDAFMRVQILHPDKACNENYNLISQMVFDDGNLAWVGTENGLLKLNTHNKTIEFINDPARRYTYCVNRLLSDSIGNLWMLSNTEIIAYNKSSKSFRYFSEANGLPDEHLGISKVFNWVDNSTIAAGSNGTITTFNPYRVTSGNISAAIILTDAYIDGNLVAPVNDTPRTIVVPADANSMMLHFALLDYTAPAQNRLYYRLTSGRNEEWIETTNGDISLLNLPPGKYTLQVKGICNGNAMNSTHIECYIHVKPHWYQSLIFKLVTVMFLGVLIFLLTRWRIKSIKRSAAIKQKISETEMAALKAQMNPHFMFNCINSIDAFIQTNDKYNATLYLNKFAKLIRNVLDSSKQNVVIFSKDIETLRLYIELEELRSENKFSVQMNIDQELLNSDYKVPPLIVQPFVENAIIHGLRNRNGNNGVLAIDISRTEKHIVYTITDNGIGRQAAATINTGKETSYGLEMSYDRIRLFNKETEPNVAITDLYESEQATGTKAIMKLNIV
ncbi:MAG: two-component regulator propeller domain-containing protein [Bacteroidota bacterium]